MQRAVNKIANCAVNYALSFLLPETRKIETHNVIASGFKITPCCLRKDQLQLPALDEWLFGPTSAHNVTATGQPALLDATKWLLEAFA